MHSGKISVASVVGLDAQVPQQAKMMLAESPHLHLPATARDAPREERQGGVFKLADLVAVNDDWLARIESKDRVAQLRSGCHVKHALDVDHVNRMNTRRSSHTRLHGL